MDKLKSLLVLYTIPLITAGILPMKQIMVNDEPIGILEKVSAGFIAGMAAEGFLMVLGATAFIALNKDRQ